MAFGRIVTWTSSQHSNAMLLCKRIGHLCRAFSRGAGVRREILIQEKNMHGGVRNGSARNVRAKSESLNVPGRISAALPPSQACELKYHPGQVHPSWCAENIQWLP